ncbi:hypothetical protein D3C77_741300 [compost metagenome]
MISDLVKTAKIKSSEIELRSFWTLGITRTIEKDRLDYLIDKYLDDKYYLTKSRKKHVLLKEIDQTPFCYIVI